MLCARKETARGTGTGDVSLRETEARQDGGGRDQPPPHTVRCRDSFLECFECFEALSGSDYITYECIGIFTTRMYFVPGCSLTRTHVRLRPLCPLHIICLRRRDAPLLKAVGVRADEGAYR